MKTKSLKKNKINIVTLGCSKNVYDSEVLMGQLQANGLPVAHESSEDDFNIVVINTCGFIDNAKEESVNTILRFAEAKNDGLVEKVYVTGCLSERYKDDLKDEIPEVDAWFGTRELPAMLKTLRADYKHELLGERLLTTPRHYAFLKISEGCDRPCSFCAIPLMRGKHVSKPMEALVKEAQHLAAGGTKELVIIAQDSTYYGLDLYKERKLAELLTQLSEVEGIEWIRLHYAFPAGFPEDVLEVMANNPKVCRYVDIPLQHISDNMLKSMRRGTTKTKTYKLLEDMRSRVPGIAIRTTLITGYPGETEADFEELCQFVRDVRFDRLGVFTYSHEENTHAFKLEDDVPEDVKKERANTIMEIQREISDELNAEKIGKTFRVLFDKTEGGYFVGRTEFDSPDVDNEVLVPTKGNYVRMGDFAEVRITDASDYDLYGEII
ncbi:MAG: 30S ribosomal protein S12 methylthiotransferase RimO [Flavobacteriales bacterium]|nr:30S ribosomal protein S12 methylthiotransferase RimO [Flavobacteriales bacterium]